VHLFDRVLWLKPARDGRPIICPSNKIDRAQLLAKCRKEFVDVGCESCKQESIGCGPDTGCKCFGACDAPAWQAAHVQADTGWRSETLLNAYYNMHVNKSMWENFSRTDLWDCGALERDLDERQCSWDASWIPQFKLDVKETKFYSVAIWIKPTSNSYGMPRFFFPYLRLTSRLSRPFALAILGELFPLKEDQFDFYDWRLQRNFLRYTGTIDYKGERTSLFDMPAFRWFAGWKA